MTRDEEARLRDVAGVVRRCREGGAFAELEEQYAAADRWTTGERDIVRDAWSLVEGVLGDEAPVDSSWRAVLTILGLLGDGDIQYGALDGLAFVENWSGGGAGYLLESVICGDLPKEARDVYKRVASHLAWEPKTPKERVIAARRKAAAIRKVLHLKRHP